VVMRVEEGVVQATGTAPLETQETRSRTEEGRSRLDALTIASRAGWGGERIREREREREYGSYEEGR
jgi:hypothetical protein